MDQKKITESWEKRRAELCGLADSIYDWAEVGLEEVKSSALLEDYLEKQGFTVEKGVGPCPQPSGPPGNRGREDPGWASSVNTMPWKAWATAAATISRARP